MDPNNSQEPSVASSNTTGNLDSMINNPVPLTETPSVSPPMAQSTGSMPTPGEFPPAGVPETLVPPVTSPDVVIPPQPVMPPAPTEPKSSFSMVNLLLMIAAVVLLIALGYIAYAKLAAPKVVVTTPTPTVEDVIQEEPPVNQTMPTEEAPATDGATPSPDATTPTEAPTDAPIGP
jgi:hypothetical protein